MFPGQGSQVPGMRDWVAEHCPELLERAYDTLGLCPFDQIDEGTRYAQPAMYCAAVAHWVGAGSPRYDYVAGHSLGEIAALVAAGCMSADDGLQLALVRGQVMQRAAEQGPKGGMMALVGDDSAARNVARLSGLPVSNDNAPGQIVVSGPDWRLVAAAARAKAQSLQAVRLRIQGAFHTRAMRPALPDFRAALAKIDFQAPSMPVFSSTTAKPFDDVRSRLAAALTHPVHWRGTLASLDQAGVARYIEAGPGRVLSGLVKRTIPNAEVLQLRTLAAGS
ncbi:MAG: ACP S-malonyltransferase [Solirubrobacterales bacterium]